MTNDPEQVGHESLAPDTDDLGTAGEAPRSIRRNAGSLFVAQMVTWVFAIGINVVQPRFLGPEGIGQLRLAFSLWLIADVVSGLGTSMLVTLETARDPSGGGRIVGSVLRLRMITYLASWFVVIAVSLAAGYEPQSLAVISLIGLSSLFAVATTTARSALAGYQAMDYPARADIASKVATVVLVITVLVAGGGVEAVAGVYVLTAAYSAWMMVRYLRRFDGVSFAGRWFDRSIVRRSLPYLLGAATLVVYVQVDMFIMSLLVDETSIGWYAAADTLFSSLLFIPAILVQALFPVLARLHAEHGDDVVRLIQRSFALLITLAVPVGLGTVVIGGPACVLLFGEEFRESGPVLSIFGVVVLLQFVTILLGSFAVATNRVAFMNTLLIIAIAVTIPLDLVLVPWADERFNNAAIGGALSYVVTEAIIAAAALAVIAPMLLVRSTAIRLVKCFAAGAALVGTAWPLRDALLPVPIVVGSMAYVTAVWALRVLDHEEGEMVRDTWGRVIGRLRRTTDAT